MTCRRLWSSPAAAAVSSSSRILDGTCCGSPPALRCTLLWMAGFWNWFLEGLVSTYTIRNWTIYWTSLDYKVHSLHNTWTTGTAILLAQYALERVSHIRGGQICLFDTKALSQRKFKSIRLSLMCQTAILHVLSRHIAS